MCIPPNVKNPSHFFSKMVKLRDSLSSNLKLSMGMSNDYEYALKSKSDIIRIGSLIFNWDQYFTFYFFYYSINVSANEIYCKFEEVYKDGSIQNGFFIIKNDGMRYQYKDKELYTLFFKNSEFFIVNHSNNKNFQKINQNTDLIEELFNLYQKYPNIKNEYSKNNLFIRLEPSLEKIFYKRT